MYAITLIFFLITALQTLTIDAMSNMPTSNAIKSLTIAQIKANYQQEPAKANYIVGIKLLNGLGLPKAYPEEAFKFFLNSAEHGLEGVLGLLQMCAKNMCFSQVIEKQLDDLLEKARNNNESIVILLYELASITQIPQELAERIRNALGAIFTEKPEILYKAALTISQEDGAKKVRMLEELADTYHYEKALLTLGKFYESGTIVGRNSARALAYYNQAAQYGSAEGLYKVGICYLEGRGSAQNKMEAFNYIKRAADMKLLSALFDMGVFYLYGDPVEQSNAQAIHYFKQAAELGDREAYAALGRLAQDGIQEDGTRGEPDHKKAFILFKHAYDKGSIIARYELAFYYNTGFNVPTDHAFAQKLYSEVLASSDKGMDILKGRMYEFGIGVEQDLEKALAYYKIALANGNNVKKYIALLTTKIAARKHYEENPSAQKNSIEIPAIEKVKKPSATRKVHKKQTAEEVAYTKLKSAEADFRNKLNEKFPCPDESVVTEVDFINNHITIERPSDKTQVILEIDPEDKQRLKRVKQYTYDDRVNTWFEKLKNTESLSAREYDSMIRHAFPQKTDYICQLFGYKTVSQENNGEERLTLAIQGQLIPGKTGTPRDGSFIYGYNPYEDIRNPLLYHRFHHDPL